MERAGRISTWIGPSSVGIPRSSQSSRTGNIGQILLWLALLEKEASVLCRSEILLKMFYDVLEMKTLLAPGEARGT